MTKEPKPQDYGIDHSGGLTTEPFPIEREAALENLILKEVARTRRFNYEYAHSEWEWRNNKTR